MSTNKHGGMSTALSQSSRRAPRPPENFVHSDRIRRETVCKELSSLHLHTEFMINPYRPGAIVTGKPNSLYDAACDYGPGDEVMSQTLKMVQQVPTAKYDQPLTSSQEYGWYSAPLLADDITDGRIRHHGRHCTELTRMKEIEWKSGLTRRATTAGINAAKSRMVDQK